MAAPESTPYYPAKPPITPHLLTSNELLAEAAAILELPDAEINGELRAQVCEKLWGATTRRLKFFADARNWYYCEHAVALQLVKRIIEALETDSPELAHGFAAAEQLHNEGFYEDVLEPDDIRYRMLTIRTFCATLDEAHRTLPLDLAPPDNRHYRRSAARCAERRARHARTHRRRPDGRPQIDPPRPA